MHFKDGVALALMPDMSKALPTIDGAHQEAGIGRDAMVTSGTDGKHMDNSLHYKGLAVDLRTQDLNQVTIFKLAAALRHRLNGDANNNRPYQVVLEDDHLHLEYDPS